MIVPPLRPDRANLAGSEPRVAAAGIALWATVPSMQREQANNGNGEHSSQPADGGHEHHHAEEFRRRFWISLVLAVPTIGFSPMIRDWLGLAEVTGVQEAVAPVFGTLVFLYGGRPFLAGAVSELRARQPGMMTLIALAITVAFVAAPRRCWGCSSSSSGGSWPR